jgi:DNA-binding NarL/FixJ family response regulator
MTHQALSSALPALDRASEVIQLKPDRAEAECRVLLVDDHPLRRASLARLLQDQPQTPPIDSGPMFRIIEVPPAPDLELASRDIRLLLLNIGGAGIAAHAATLHDLLRQADGIPLVVLSDFDRVEDVVEALQAGARGFLTTRIEPRLMFSALRFILGGGAVFPPDALLADRAATSESLLPAQGGTTISLLTQRQRDVLRRLGQGHSNKVIAKELHMCESTVKVHVRQIMRKLRAANRTQAALQAMEMLRQAETPSVIPSGIAATDLSPSA